MVHGLIKPGSYRNLEEQDAIHKLLNLAQEQISEAALIGTEQVVRIVEMGNDLDTKYVKACRNCEKAGHATYECQRPTWQQPRPPQGPDPGESVPEL